MTRQWPSMSVAIQFSGTTWTDVTAYVQTIGASRGRTYELDQSRPGQLTIMLDNHSGAFDPANTTSAYYPNVTLYRPIRVQATWNSTTTTLWQGYVERWPQSYRSSGNWQMTPLLATDILGVLRQKVFLSSGEEMIQQQGPTYWWPLSSGTGTNGVQERVNGVNNGTVSTFGGSKQVSLGSNPYTTPPLGLEGSGGASFTPAQPGYGYPSNMSAIRLMQPVTGQFFPWPLVPWTITFVVQTGTRCGGPDPSHTPAAWFLEWTDSGGGNGTGKIEFIRFGVSSRGLFYAAIQDANGSFVQSEFGTQLADGLPHVVSIEYSGTAPNFYYSVDSQGFGTISSGNVNGWVFDQIVLMNLGGSWATNQAATGAYAGVISEVAWFGGQHLVTDGTGGSSPGFGKFAGSGFGTGNLPDVIVNAWNGQTTDQRVQSLMTLAGYGTQYVSLGTGQAVLQGAVISGKDAASTVLDVGDTEGGPVYVRGDGKLVFSPRFYRYTPTPTLTIGDGTSYPVSGLELSYDTQHVVTQAEIDRLGGNACIATNTAQLAALGLWTKQVSGSGENTDNQCFSHAQYIVGWFGAPKTRVGQLKIDMGGNPAAFALLNTLDINTCIRLQHTPLGGNPISLVLWVESVKYDITPDRFVLEIDATPADARTWLMANTTGSNTLDNSSLLLAF